MLTFRREDQLPAAIDALLTHKAEFDATHADTVRVRILVVDNDPVGSAGPIVSAYDPNVVHYEHEPEPGISAGRNHALDASRDERLLVFIDDDERPGPGWLATLYQFWEDQGRPPAIAGPVRSEIDSPIDPWVTASRFYTRRYAGRLQSGQSIRRAATNNLLLDVPSVLASGVRFDLAFGLTGGGDTMFTESLTRTGARMIWCRDAFVTEVVPPHRLTKSYVLRRTFSLSNVSTTAKIALAGTPSRRARARVAEGLKAVVHTVRGAISWAFGAVTGSDRHRAMGHMVVARGRGALAASVGHRYSEYRRS